MTKNLETLAPRPETIKHLQAAFPSYLSKDVEAVVAILPTCFLEPTQYDVGPITISGELIHIPSRIYSPEPRLASLYGLSAQELAILACIYTRHHDGFIRQKYLEKLFSQDEIWVCPFVLQLIGEYVVEIIEVILHNINRMPMQSYHKFINENPAFVYLLKQRIVSYWNCYYRSRFPHFEHYVGFQIANMLGLWNKNDVRHLLAR